MFNRTPLLYEGRRVAKVLTVAGGAATSTTQSKFGGSSLYLPNGSGTDWVQFPNSTSLAFGTGDFAVECFIYMTSISSYHTIWVSGREPSVGNFAMYVNGGSTIEIYNNGSGPVLATFATSISTNTWYHIAVTRSSGTMYAFLNGTQQGSSVSQSYNFQSTTGSQNYTFGTIGYDGSTGFNFQGYIDELRISTGTARYTSNFTAPTAPFDCDGNTRLLCHFDNPNGSTYIVDDNL